ncbi:hypothetical protein [Frankia canadensis]|nr:hypothetical protein [Frankia canadensis]
MADSTYLWFLLGLFFQVLGATGQDRRAERVGTAQPRSGPV